ncbi:unnamed protein product [Ilex paraguariensis]|uniref:Uncharacterized protein n=1 Tax=Ilex paraguariensis TaxID=185542 RepID=A0ABC8UH28_9AQUA
MELNNDMESIVETMMQQLLSKEILHEPMKEVGERYPKWLADNKTKLSSQEYERYSHQYEQLICMVLDVGFIWFCGLVLFSPS